MAIRRGPVDAGKIPAVNIRAISSNTIEENQKTLAFKAQAEANASKLFGTSDLLVLLCIIIWAVNVPLVKLLLGTMSPLEISISRYSVGAVFFLILVLITEKSLRIKLRHLPLLLLAGFVGITLNQVFFVYALQNASSSEVSLLMASTPSFATLIAWLAGQEKIKLNYWVSLPLAVGGVVLIVLTAPGAHIGGNFLGDGLALLTACSWGSYTVLIRPLLRHYSIAKLSVYVLVFGVIGMLPFGFSQLNFAHFTSLTPTLWLTLFYCTFVALVITNFLWYGGVKNLGAPRTAFYAYLQPFGGVVAASFILGELIVPWQIGGGLLVVLSMILYRTNLKLTFNWVAAKLNR